MATKTRRQSLESAIADLDKARVRELDTVAILERDLYSHRREQVSLQEKRLAACKLEALGEKNNHISIAEAIKALEVKIAGFEMLIAEAHERVLQLRRDSEPFEQEFQVLLQQEDVERQAHELEVKKRKRLDAVLSYWREHANLMRAETELSSGFTDERIRNAGRDFAVSLEAAAKNGMRVSELFTPAELKEFA